MGALVRAQARVSLFVGTPKFISMGRVAQFLSLPLRVVLMLVRAMFGPMNFQKTHSPSLQPEQLDSLILSKTRYRQSGGLF